MMRGRAKELACMMLDYGDDLALAAEAVVARHRLLATDAACPEEASLPRDVAELAAALAAWRRVTGRET